MNFFHLKELFNSIFGAVMRVGVDTLSPPSLPLEGAQEILV